MRRCEISLCVRSGRRRWRREFLPPAGPLSSRIPTSPRDRADADVKNWQAELARARSDLERLERAIRTNAVSQQEVDRARSDLQQAEGNLLGA